MNQKLVGALLAVAGIVLIGLAIATAYQNSCPASTYNGTGPPPAGQPCPEHFSWSGLALAALVAGALLVPSGGVVAVYHRD